MRMGDGYGEGVRGIGAGNLHPGKKPRDHRMDLRLFRAARTDNRLLDQRGRIFANLDPCPGGAHQYHPARLPELQCRLRVLVDEHFLDGGGSRRVARDQCLELIGECGKPARKRRGGVGLDLPVADMRQPVAFSLDEPPAGRAKAGIEPEDDQASFSSSSSGTS
jgi:hypothetical protein